ncbi:hypothetical protein CC78DRAFT_539025 [Lojkania enalia]|uniref:Uncharacterized protein n=1 Tax=Lojkania enalia TaxID=147567 RepID=A0A9P4NCC3_9PLEO|nr:hypothetical protein CC78DRAFT_539025 [Didymosphaeria enalia]
MDLKEPLLPATIVLPAVGLTIGVTIAILKQMDLNNKFGLQTLQKIALVAVPTFLVAKWWATKIHGPMTHAARSTNAPDESEWKDDEKRCSKAEDVIDHILDDLREETPLRKGGELSERVEHGLSVADIMRRATWMSKKRREAVARKRGVVMG